IAPGGGWLAAADSEGQIRLYELAPLSRRERELGRFVNHRSWPFALLYLDDETLVCGRDDGSVERWSLGDPPEETALGRDGGPVTALALADKGRVLLSAAKTGTITARDVRTGETRKTLTLSPAGEISSLASPDDGVTVIAGVSDG